ncbi:MULTISPECIES: hypothetical protein [Bradyrhizobium]|uniref:hypothetical protein n=1 Tax=Bradyrhizobium TaxID=374 RepID=UPI001142C39E|nr:MULTISPECIES: hypothetical protein [Bradyrhizobium]UFW51142.1 hypothetical protein BaraCB756_08970 [Bradyrhizobium arachidis]
MGAAATSRRTRNPKDLDSETVCVVDVAFAVADMNQGQRAARQYLAEAEQHVALGKRHIARQVEIIDELARADHDTGLALDLFQLSPDAGLPFSASGPHPERLGGRACPAEMDGYYAHG